MNEEQKSSSASQQQKTDEQWMRRAIAEAEAAFRDG